MALIAGETENQARLLDLIVLMLTILISIVLSFLNAVADRKPNHDNKKIATPSRAGRADRLCVNTGTAVGARK